jgi:RNA 2',3'-cyclic 3'-phosphodiesterase
MPDRLSMEKNAIRAFIAIELSPGILQELDTLCQRLKREMGDGTVRWVPAKNIHLTLKFLGDAPFIKIDTIKEILRTKASLFSSFSISIGQIGAFPSIHKPRVIWVGVQAPGGLIQLYEEIELGMELLGFAREDRPFSAHLTIGRLMKNANSGELKAVSRVLSEANVGILGTDLVEKVNLFKSDLKPTGAVYTCLYTAPLLEKFNC